MYVVASLSSNPLTNSQLANRRNLHLHLHRAINQLTTVKLLHRTTNLARICLIIDIHHHICNSNSLGWAYPTAVGYNKDWRIAKVDPCRIRIRTSLSRLNKHTRRNRDIHHIMLNNLIFPLRMDFLLI